MRLTILLFFLTQHLFAQQNSVSGVVKDHDGKAVPGALITIKETAFKTNSNEGGEFLLEGITPGKYVIVFQMRSFDLVEQEIDLSGNGHVVLDVVLQKDPLQLNEVIVSANRTQFKKQDSPILLSTISSRTLEITQSLSIAEGLGFTPGLRVDNNCQNCGFTQLRMNGLDGAYTQVLINSRPIFSALAGVYGLEILPANMVERIEIMRGGGSVLYGGNAIAGTVNIITRDPALNSVELGINQSLTNFEASDRSMNLTGALVDKNLKKGLNFYAFRRNRDQWDANGDGFSELTLLENTSIGFDYFNYLKKTTKLKLGVYHMREFRRGGNNFHLKPHETDLTEQLAHRIWGAQFSIEHYLKDPRHKLSLYGASQLVHRDSYYGSGGRIIQPGDSLTESDIRALNAYGLSSDISVVTGIQYVLSLSEKYLMTIGSEFQFNDLKDEMSGYDRKILQESKTIGNYAQMQWRPIRKWTYLLGIRYDLIAVDGYYAIVNEVVNEKRIMDALVPRLATSYEFKKNWKFRASYAQGYRAPQTFNEDLHIQTVGGDARFIRLSDDLKVERSNSFSGSLNFEKRTTNFQYNSVLEVFYTYLKNPFILSDQQQLQEGVSVVTKRNGDGATVYGSNLEFNLAYKSKVILQSGLTLQRARFEVDELIWSSQDSLDIRQPVGTKNLLRTPDLYAFYSLLWKVDKRLKIAFSGIYTGSMRISHVLESESGFTVIKRTPGFMEFNFKLSYTFNLKKEQRLELFAGVHNLFNSYQLDFDIGMYRDAGYVYGPSRPRTIFFGLKYGVN